MNSEKEELLKKMQQYCSWRDRCITEVENKLYPFKLNRNDSRDIIESLIRDKYLDEKRFAESYVRSKFSYNNWGRIKIRLALRNKRINEDIISESLEQIPEEDYLKTINKLAKKKNEELDKKNPDQKALKVYSFLVSKGFEPDLVSSTIKQIPIE